MMSKNKCWEEDCEITPVKKCVDCDNMICIVHTRGIRCGNCTREGWNVDENTEEYAELKKKLEAFLEENKILKAENQKRIEKFDEMIKKQQNIQFGKPLKKLEKEE